MRLVQYIAADHAHERKASRMRTGIDAERRQRLFTMVNYALDALA